MEPQEKLPRHWTQRVAEAVIGLGGLGLVALAGYHYVNGVIEDRAEQDRIKIGAAENCEAAQTDSRIEICDDGVVIVRDAAVLRQSDSDTYKISNIDVTFDFARQAYRLEDTGRKYRTDAETDDIIAPGPRETAMTACHEQAAPPQTREAACRSAGYDPAPVVG